MSDKRTNEIGRRREYRRRLRGEKKAVSPVVATLILILIAVAAAAALYLWLVAWQGGVTKGIGSPTAQYTVTIGGSSSVYPWSVIAANSFEQNNSNIVISINQGGSGAGDAAVCSGQVDIGASSAPVTATQLETNDGCPSTVVQETVAYDAVDVIVPSGNPHAINNVTWDTMQSIYIAGGGGLSALTPTTNLLTAYSMNGVATSIAPASSAGFAWDQIPACVPAPSLPSAAYNCAGSAPEQGTVAATNTQTTFSGFSCGACAATGTATATGTFAVTNNAGLTSISAITLTGATAGVVTITSVTPATSGGTGPGGFGTGNVNVGFSVAYTVGPPTAVATATLSYTQPGATGCGWTVCASGASTIHPWQRSDTSGTTQSFTSRILAVKASGNAPSGLGFTGCGSGGQLTECGISVAHQAFGNPGVIAGVKGDPDGIGYASDGLVIASGSGVVPIGLQGYGQTNAVFPSVSKGTIINGIVSGTTDVFSSTTYVGWRPFVYIQIAPPTGEVLRYLQWCFQPGNNQQFASAAGELSPYQPGLAGVVPVTPIP